jgi:hypothetical protein
MDDDRRQGMDFTSSDKPARRRIRRIRMKPVHVSNCLIREEKEQE